MTPTYAYFANQIFQTNFLFQIQNNFLKKPEKPIISFHYLF